MASSSSSSSTGQTKTSDNQSNKTSKTTTESKEVKTKSLSTNIKEESNHHLNVSPSRDQASNRSPHLKNKRSFSPFVPSLQSNFFPHAKQASTLRLSARPFEEVALGPSSSDAQNETVIKSDGSSTSWTEKN